MYFIKSSGHIGLILLDLFLDIYWIYYISIGQIIHVFDYNYIVVFLNFYKLLQIFVNLWLPLNPPVIQ